MNTFSDGQTLPPTGIPVSQLVGDQVAAAPATASARAAAEHLNEAGVGLIIVGSAEDVKGVVSERDIVRAVASGVDLDTASATDIGSTDLRWIPLTATVADAIDEMMTGYHRHLLVRDDGGDLAGVLSIRDLLAAYPT